MRGIFIGKTLNANFGFHRECVYELNFPTMSGVLKNDCPDF